MFCRNPTPEINDVLPVKWEPALAEKQYYFDIGNELKMISDPDESRLQFWEEFL